MKWITALMIAAALGACHSPNQNAQSEAAAQTLPRAEALLEAGVRAYEQQNYTDAMTAFTQASAAGEMEAPRYIGMMYLNGYGVGKNAQRAVVEFAKAARLGDATAQFWLGYCHEQGIGVPRDLDEAAHWYHISAQRGGDISAPAMTALGRLAESENKEEAANWYRKAAAAGAQEAVVAQHLLAGGNP